ncbi:uncharacterized protein [Diabrotica undecimpunctata]|uniref:uncharacterized protein n=1 Tax=Diabrotica undecimpunctata TaxID=50387 RepID=UPI003B63B103
MSKDEAFCENYFNKTVFQDSSGKFIVRFPLKLESTELGESKDLEIKRLLSQERKLENNKALKDKYFKFMNEYLELEQEHQFAVIADNEKMYRQILIHPDNRYLQNIVWRQNPNDTLLYYELQTVTYGTTSAPHLAIKFLKRLAAGNKHDYPIACELVDCDMYVDDLKQDSAVKSKEL